MAIPLRPIARRALAAQSDDRLVRLLREGHQPAFDEIVRRYRGPLVAFAGAIAGASRAEDVVQAGLMRAHGALGEDDREIRLRPWLFAIVRNGALNAVRDEPAWSELDPEQHGERRAAATAEQREELERLVDAICALPESQRQALVMREMEGVGHAEIAAKLQTSPTAVRGLIFRARTTLRNALGALVPLPLLRWLLEDAAAAAAAGAAGGAGAGAAGAGGSALLGGAFGKAAVGLTAAVVAVGAGKAIQDRRGGDDRPGTGPEVARAATGAGAESRGEASDGGGSGRGGAAASEERREAARESAEERRERQAEAGEEEREAREDRRDERRDEREDRRDDAGDSDDDHSGHSGSGGGSSGSSGSGGGGGHSGSGGTGGDDDEADDDRFEPEEPEEPEEPDEPEELDDDDDDEDHSDSGPGSDDD